MEKIAFIYPGQGSQKMGMGKEFYDAYSSARAIYQEASEKLGIDMQALCFEENDRLHMTEYTQAALVTTCLAMTKVLLEEGEDKNLFPYVTAGLSLGEYTAIAVAGGMKPIDAITTVRNRGLLMEHAVPRGEGAMAAVLGLTGEEIEKIIETISGVSIANYNCPGQIVITGEKMAVEEATDKLKSGGAKGVVMLNVSGPFHSPMLQEAGKELEVVLNQVSWEELQIPYVNNVCATFITDIQDTKDLLSQQISAPVRWEQSIRCMIEAGVDTFVEIGPGKTLSGFLKKIDRNVATYKIENIEDMNRFLEDYGIHRRRVLC